jgi:hypothetical protein
MFTRCTFIKRLKSNSSINIQHWLPPAHITTRCTQLHAWLAHVIEPYHQCYHPPTHHPIHPSHTCYNSSPNIDASITHHITIHALASSTAIARLYMAGNGMQTDTVSTQSSHQPPIIISISNTTVVPPCLYALRYAKPLKNIATYTQLHSM